MGREAQGMMLVGCRSGRDFWAYRQASGDASPLPGEAGGGGWQGHSLSQLQLRRWKGRLLRPSRFTADDVGSEMLVVACDAALSMEEVDYRTGCSVPVSKGGC